MKKLFTAMLLIVMLFAGTGVAGASDADTEKKVTKAEVSVVDSSYSTLRKPIVME